MDFNRFPGSTPKGADHGQFISGYLARDLDYIDKRWILDTLYDVPGYGRRHQRKTARHLHFYIR